MRGITAFEFDYLLAQKPTQSVTGQANLPDCHLIPPDVFNWLELQCLQASTGQSVPWLRLRQRQGQRAIQLSHYVGVICSPQGYQIEVLPKMGKIPAQSIVELRRLLLKMLTMVPGLHHIQLGPASVAAAKLPLYEIILGEFLHRLEAVIQGGLRYDYGVYQDNLAAWRGKLLVTQHLQHNLYRPERCFMQHTSLTANRAENRLLHTALQATIHLSTSAVNQRRAHALLRFFDDIPCSPAPASDWQKVRLEKGMQTYRPALDWARLILDQNVPLTGMGPYRIPSLLFPMEAVFEFFVAAQLKYQVCSQLRLKTQVQSHHLIEHEQRAWFHLRPDVVIYDQAQPILVLDTKWKLLDSSPLSKASQYGLHQRDIQQLQAYGQSYLNSQGAVILIYPRTPIFQQPLPVFQFPKLPDLSLWVLPFCLQTNQLLLPPEAPFTALFAPSVAKPDSSTLDKSARQTR